jgi:all-trans-8'-apo-beta-carotenal 15,15'-oxygenase
MNRRNFLAGAAGAITFGAHATSSTAATVISDSPDPVFDAFAATLAKQPWQMGYEGLQADAEPMALRLRGKLPRELRGAFYRNGPARHSLGGVRYHHLFDGDGMVQKYELADGGIVHAGKFVRTEKFAADSKAGRPVRAAFGTIPAHPEPMTGPDSLNAANTSVVKHAGELLALWEGGSATRIDEATLDTRGTKTWTPEYAGMPFSAHPKIERDGTLWNFGVTSHLGLLSVYRIGAGGEVIKTETIKVRDVAMVHDFGVTERHLVFLLPPLVFDRDRARAGETFLDSHVWKPQMGMRVLVLPKDHLDQPQWFELPTGFVFHIGNAWEDTIANTIRLDYIRSPDAWSPLTGLRDLMSGRFEHTGNAGIAFVGLNLNTGRANQTLLQHETEFPRVDPRVVGVKHSQLFTAARIDTGPRPGFDSVMRLDIASGKTDRYRYGSDVMVEEHIFVPRPAGSGKEGDGWLVGTALDLKKKAMLFSVFDAMQLAQGPIAQGTLDRVMPLGLHAIFVGA